MNVERIQPFPSRQPHKLRVGVSIFVRKGEQSVWENGIYQNCIFLVMLLMLQGRPW